MRNTLSMRGVQISLISASSTIGPSKKVRPTTGPPSNRVLGSATPRSARRARPRVSVRPCQRESLPSKGEGIVMRGFASLLRVAG